MTERQIENFYKKVIRDSDDDACWGWDGATSGGQGMVALTTWYETDGLKYKVCRAYLATRVMYTLEVGPIPWNTCVCHTCDRPPCMAPHHFFLGTQQDNMRDARAKSRLVVPDNNTSAKWA